MRARFLFAAFGAALATASGAAVAPGLACLGIASCTDDELGGGPVAATDASLPGRDGSTVEPLDGGAPGEDANAGPLPTCQRYCDLVMHACKGSRAQYESNAACLAFCGHLALGDPGDKGASVACRQYYAGNPSLADPVANCAAAGPLGGGICGDRCTAFCDVATSACPPTGGSAPYPSRPDCATACVGFAFEDPSADGGGEGPNGPDAGDTLNCRLFYLRRAVADPTQCLDLAADSGPCR